MILFSHVFSSHVFFYGTAENQVLCARLTITRSTPIIQSSLANQHLFSLFYCLLTFVQTTLSKCVVFCLAGVK